MKLRMSFLAVTCCLLAGSVLAAGRPILVVDSDLRQTVIDQGLRVYGLTDNSLLLEDVPPARQLASQVILPGTNQPLYLVWSRHPDALAKVHARTSPLLRDGPMSLVQTDATTAQSLTRLGVQLVLLPETPHLLRTTVTLVPPAPALPDSFIQRLVNRVNQDSIRYQIQRLQDCVTRFSSAESCRAAEQYVADYFTRLGLDSVELDSYEHSGQTWRNVVGTRLGRVNPEKVVIVCGHMDCTSEDPYNLAPGAEDNASGTAMAIEAARVLAREDFDVTLKFIAWTGEEQGLIGSEDYAARMRAQNTDIIGVLNFDMIAWEGGQFGVELYCNQASLPLADFEEQMCALYTTLTHHITVGSYGSDQLSFHAQGYMATAGAEHGSFYPYYHTTADTIGNCSLPLAAEVARMAVATAAMLGLIPAPPDSFQFRDVGLGGRALASWAANREPDLAGYKLMYGTSSHVYPETIDVGLDLSRELSGLTNGDTYYGAVAAYDASGHLGAASSEQSAAPGTSPLVPSGFAAWPRFFSMKLTWLRNSELDLAGYNLYRSTLSGGNYTRLNSAPFTDTAYSDSGLLADTTYYYVIAAVDTTGTESQLSPEQHGKPVTLDHGTLLVDETRNGTGQPGSPSDAQVDDFYHSVLRGYRYLDWDVTSQGVPTAGDIGPYSTIVWHADDIQEQRVDEALPGLRNYLNAGGKLWMSGWKPLYGIVGNRAYTYPYQTGQFAFDFLHLNRAALSQAQDFIGANGMNGCPSVATDSVKMFAAWRGRLPFVEALVPRDADTILTFQSYSGDTFQDRPVAVRWLSGPNRVVFFGFPFYYVKDAEAIPVAQWVMQQLGEPYAVDEARTTMPSSSRLLGARPNPARTLTGIEYELAAAQHVRLTLYDAVGREVRELVNGFEPAGRHLAVWNRCTREDRPVPSGLYFYRLESRELKATGKLELLP